MKLRIKQILSKFFRILIILILLFITNLFPAKPINGQQQNQEGYLIVTRNMFRNSLKPLVDNKTAKGLRVTVETVENINNTQSGRDIQEKIRNYLKAKRAEDPNLKWVLLVGDADPSDSLRGSDTYRATVLDKAWEVPPRYLFVSSVSKFVLSDYYYANLDGTWDNNNNNIFGEFEDSTYEEGHWFPILYVGRIPVKTTAELDGVVNKIINYQPPSSDRFLIVNFQNDPFEQKLTNKGIAYKELIGPTEAQLNSEINSGAYSSVMATGHSDGYTLWSLSGGQVMFTATDALNSTNSKPFGASYLGCGINNFDKTNDTIPEASLKDPNGGSIFSFGPTGVGPNGNEAGSYVDFEFYDEYLDGHTQVGEAFYRALYQGGEAGFQNDWRAGAGVLTEYRYSRERAIENVLLGDPELKLGNVPYVQPPAMSKISSGKLSVSPSGELTATWYNPRDTFVFTIFYNSIEMIENTSIEMVVPNNVTLVDGSISKNGQYDPATRKITWSLGTISPGWVQKYVSFTVNAN